MSSNSSADLSFIKINRDNPEPEKSSKKIVLFSGGIVVLATILIWIFWSSEPVINVDSGIAIMTSAGEENALLVASGYVVAQRKASVASKGTGRLEYLAVIEGDKVIRDQIIGRLERSDVEAVLGQARANLNVAKAGLETAEADLEEAELMIKRQQTLLKQNLISPAEFETSNSRFKRSVAMVQSAKASVLAAEAGVRSAEVSVENTNVRAPFDGVVLTKNANVGEVISPFAAASGSRGALVTIADMNSLEVEAEVSESNIQKVKENQPCEIILEAYPNQRYPGFVNKIVPTADRAKATVLTKVRFKEKDARVLPEMRAKVNFLSAEMTKQQVSEPKLTVPLSAVTTRNNQKVVFIINDSAAEETAVSLGEVMGTRIQVLSGITPGQKLILKPTEDIRTGVQVSTK